MRMEDVDARRAYIRNARNSFDAPGRRYEFEKEENTKGEMDGAFSFFKIRLLIAAFLFAAYIVCDRTNASFYRFTAKDISEKIAWNINLEAAKEEALQAFAAIEGKLGKNL